MKTGLPVFDRQPSGRPRSERAGSARRRFWLLRASLEDARARAATALDARGQPVVRVAEDEVEEVGLSRLELALAGRARDRRMDLVRDAAGRRARAATVAAAAPRVRVVLHGTRVRRRVA